MTTPLLTSQSIHEVLDATHVTVTVTNAATGQQWTLLAGQPKAQGVTAADALFDLLTLTGAASGWRVSKRFHQEAK